MDFEKIKTIRSYVKKILKFKKLERFSNLSDKKFHNEMALIFPEFSKDYSKVFETVTHNSDLTFLKMMFKKLEDIEDEFSVRKGESKFLEPIINEIRRLLSEKNGITKDELVLFVENNNYDILDKYPIIIDRLLDNEYNKFTAEDMLLEQIKYNHEISIGNALAEKFIYPKIGK